MRKPQVKLSAQEWQEKFLWAQDVKYYNYITVIKIAFTLLSNQNWKIVWIWYYQQPHWKSILTAWKFYIIAEWCTFFFFFLIAWPSCVLWRKSIVSDSRRQGRIRRLHDASGLLFCASRFICLLPLRFLLIPESLLNSLQWWAKGCDLFSFSKCLKWLDGAFGFI